MRPVRPQVLSKIGITIGADGKSAATDRTRAQVQPPAAAQGEAETKSFYYTYFTQVVDDKGNLTQVLYNGDRKWAKITLVLETAGPVAVGNQQGLDPVTSGKGILLDTGVPLIFTVAKGTRIYVTCTAINRIKVMIEPLPWLEQITGSIGNFIGRFIGR